MNRHPFLPVILLILATLVGAGCLQQESPGKTIPTHHPHHATMEALLGNVTSSIQESLVSSDLVVSDVAADLGRTGISGPGAEAVLREAVGSHPLILTMITYDRNGTVQTAEPESAKVLVGQDLSGQENVRKSLSTGEPLMSDLFPLSQGGFGISISHPVHSRHGEFIGVVSMVFLPYELITPPVEREVNGTPYSFQVLETDALILYDPDPVEVGKETFNETFYAEFPGIERVARQVVANHSGYDTYSFYSTGYGRIVEKETFWSTASLHGTEWRVMVIGEV